MNGSLQCIGALVRLGSVLADGSLRPSGALLAQRHAVALRVDESNRLAPSFRVTY